MALTLSRLAILLLDVVLSMAAGNFEKALGVVLQNEGGFVNVKEDKGGATNMGISTPTFISARKQGIISCEDIRKLTRAEAAAIYEKMYWYPCSAEDMPFPLDVVHFDAAVNHGNGGAAKILQRAINTSLGPGTVSVDGKVGPKTLEAVRVCTQTESRLKIFCTVLLSTRQTRFNEIIAADASQQKFAKGWANRVKRMQAYVDSVLP